MRRCEKVALVVFVAVVFGVVAQADPVSGSLFNTTFSGWTKLHKFDLNYNGANFKI